MKRIVLAVVLVLISSPFAMAKDNYYEEIEKLKGAKIEVLYRDYNKTEMGVIVDLFMMNSYLQRDEGWIKIVTDKKEEILINVLSIKSIKIIDKTGVVKK